jgi:hypothetical protein
MAAAVDMLIEKLPLAELETAMRDVVVYLEKITGGTCTYNASRKSPELTILVVSQKDRQAVLHVHHDTDENTDNVEGDMRSLLSPPSADGALVPLLSFADLLDFIIVHLCPIVCIPRALFYMAFSMKLALPAASVDSQFAIDEQDGEFVLQNLRAAKECRFRIVDADAIHYESARKQKAVVLPAPVFDGMEPVVGYDFVQHAFARKAVFYTQHPLVAKALRKLLKEIDYVEMDPQLRVRAQELMLSLAQKKDAPATV